MPLHRRLAAEIKAPVILHICGNTSDRIGMIAQTGLACFHWDTKTGSPAEARRLAGPRLALMGGVSNYKLLRGTPAEIAADAALARRPPLTSSAPNAPFRWRRRWRTCWPSCRAGRSPIRLSCRVPRLACPTVFPHCWASQQWHPTSPVVAPNRPSSGTQLDKYEVSVFWRWRRRLPASARHQRHDPQNRRCLHPAAGGRSSATRQQRPPSPPAIT